MDMKKNTKQRLFEVMSRLDKTFKPKLNEDNYTPTFRNYEDVVFLQGDDAREALNILNSKGEEAALEYLKSWHDEGTHELTNSDYGSDDDYDYADDGYAMYWNPEMGHIGLKYNINYSPEAPDDDRDAMLPYKQQRDDDLTRPYKEL